MCFCIAIGLILIMPFILTAIGTFKTDAEIIAFPPKFFPAVWHVENWAKVWTTDIGSGGTFPRWLFNTAFLSVTIAILEVIFCSMAAYAFARLEFPGRDAVFAFMLATMMIPCCSDLDPCLCVDDKTAPDQYLLVFDHSGCGQCWEHISADPVL